MKAARLVKQRAPLEIVELPDPAPAPDEVIVQVDAEGICRTDWHVWNGDWGWVGMTPDLPLVLGHELGGRVVATGSEVRSVAEGDRVTVPFHEACGRCRYCLVGRSNLCERLQFIGLTHDGGYARFAAIRNADFNVVHLPDSVDALSAAAIGCRYMTAFHAVVHRGGLRAGQWVVVHGAGGVGLSAVQIAAALGGRVIAVDLAPAKLAKARDEGAEHTVDASSQDVVEAVRAVTGEGAHLAVGAIGVAALVNNAVLSLRKGGRLVQVGLTSQAEQGYVPLALDHLIENEIEIAGSVGNPHAAYPELLDQAEQLGHAAYAPTYPGHWPGAARAGIRHDDYVAAVTRFIEGRDLRDVVLVGHSFGGSVVSRVAQVIPERLKRLVFHTAFVVEDGTSVNDNLAPEQTVLFARSAKASPDNTVECPWEVFRDQFIQDASAEDARSVWERLVPQPFQPWDARLDLAEFYRGALPRSYIAVSDDRALPAGAWHPGMSRRLGAFKLVEMGGSHEVMFTRPAELARKLAEASND